MDRAFKLCPESCYQIYTIQVLNNNQVFPCVFSLLPNKNKDTYNLFLSEIFNVVIHQGAELKYILIFFDRAVINAANMQIPQT